jgi:polysaccharide transporter, PST family
MINKILKQLSPRITIMLTNQISILLTLPWLINQLTPMTFGLLATALIILQAGWIVIDWAQMNFVTEIWHRYPRQTQKNKLISQLILSRLILAGGYLFLIGGFIAVNIINLPWTFFAVICPGIVAGGLLPLWFFHAIKRPNELVAITLTARIFFVISVFLFVRGDPDATNYLAFQSLSLVVITLFAFNKMITGYRYRWQTSKFKGILKQIRIGSPFMLNTFTNNYIHIFWGLALTMMAGPVVIGMYSLAEQAYRAGSAITTALAQVIRVNSINQTLSQTRSIVLTFIFWSLIITLGGQWVISEYLSNFLPNSYEGAVTIFRIMLTIWLVQTWIKLINYPILGKIRGLDKLHQLDSWILLIHFTFIFAWALMTRTLDSFTEYFLLASISQFIFLITPIIIKRY